MMKNFRIIPSLLIKDKRLVKGKNFKNHIDSGDPVKTCVAYDSQLADEIILVDLGAFEKKTKPDFETLDKVVNECNTPLTFGGNISNLDDAICAITLADIDHLIDSYDVILIDEIQFYNDAAFMCDIWANKGKIVECYGLSGDYKREPFEQISKLIPLCDKITHLTAIDRTNGEDAPF